MCAIQLRSVRVHVQIFYGKDADNYRLRYLAGKEPDQTPYGFHLAQNEGFTVTFSQDADRNGNDFVIRVLRKIFDFDILHAYSNRARLREADVIWTMTEGEAFAIALLCSVGVIPQRPIIANAVWVFNQWKDLPIWKKSVYRYLTRFISVMTVHSSGCLAISRHAFPNLRTQLLYFGINTDMFKVAAPSVKEQSRQCKIFAPGNDATRDWDTLLLAFGNDERFSITIMCPWLNADHMSCYQNVTLIHPAGMGDLLGCYEDADVIAIPMKDNMFSGITVALEAVAMGKPLLATRTGGVPTYFSEDELFYAPIGDAYAMREILLATNPELRSERAQKAQKRFLGRDYSTRAVVRRYTELTREILNNRPPLNLHQGESN